MSSTVRRVSDQRTDPTFLRDQYSSECGLTTRASIWHPTVEGLTPHDVVLARLRDHNPRELLDVGCGTGALAEWIASELHTSVTGIDQSERMVELTRHRGISAIVADAGSLPFDTTATTRFWPRGCFTTLPISTWLCRKSAGCFGRGAFRRRDQRRWAHRGSAGRGWRTEGAVTVQPRERRSRVEAALRSCRRRPPPYPCDRRP